MYKENPKTKGSGIICCIPQKGTCPIGCEDCFFQSGRSFLEPLAENLPNMPPLKMTEDRVVRVNDGNDSNNCRSFVIEAVWDYRWKFYNTSIPLDLECFDAPVVLTVNPGKMTDSEAYLINPIPLNLMFVRFRTNTWNTWDMDLCDRVVEYYSARSTPVVLTFMAYFTGLIPDAHKFNYVYRKRTLNEYWAISTEAWEKVMDRYRRNLWVYSCGKVEGISGGTACSRCGNCLREYFGTMERMGKG